MKMVQLTPSRGFLAGPARACSLAMIALVTLLGATRPANAGLIVDWDFDPVVQTVATTDTIFMTATVTVDPSSTEGLLAIISLRFPLEDFLGEYDFTFGGPFGFDADAPVRNLEPGESATFLFGVLTPFGGSAAPGTYLSGFATIDFQAQSLAMVEVGGKQFTAHVAAAVPEPSVLFLLISGFAALALRGGRRPALH